MRTVGPFCVGLLAAASAAARHGFGTFAMNEDIELAGVITGLDFVNRAAI